MNKKIILLGGLLALQAVLIAFTHFQSKTLLGHTGMQTLLDFNQDQIDRIIVAGRPQQVELRRTDQGWTTGGDFPAETERVNRLLERLKNLKHGLAVARTEAAQQRFNLTDDHYERRVQLYINDKEVANLTVGSGAGARRSHVKAGDAKEVYAVAIGNHDLPVDIGQWQDKTLLELEAATVTAVQVGDLTIRQATEAEPPSDVESSDQEDSSVVKADSIWMVDNLAENQIFEAKNFKRDIDRLLGLRYNRAHTHSELTELAESSEAQNRIILQMADGSARSYDLFKSKEGGEWLLKVSDRDEIFVLTSYLGTRLGEQLVADKLIKSKETAESDKSEETAEENKL